GPAGHQPRHVLADDRLAEDHAAQDVADRAVGRLPHLLEAELLHARLVGRDRGAFHAHTVLLDGICRVDGDLVVRLVALLNAQVEIFEVDIEIGVDQFFLDELPDDARHLVPVEFDDGIVHLDLRHEMNLVRIMKTDGLTGPPRPGCGPYSIVGQQGKAGGWRTSRKTRPCSPAVSRAASLSPEDMAGRRAKPLPGNRTRWQAPTAPDR